MRPPRLFPPARRLLTLLLALVASQSLSAQIQVCARYKDELLPVLTRSPDNIFVLQNGSSREATSSAYEIRAAKLFGPGFVTISDVRADLNPPQDPKRKEVKTRHVVHCRYHALLVADRALADCYALLSFVSEGSVGTIIQPIGRIAAGKPQELDIEVPQQVDSIGSLHLFSHTAEIRTTQHPKDYDLQGYFNALTSHMRGLSAAELLKYADIFSHALSPDGKLLAAVHVRDAKKMLFVYNLDSMQLLFEQAMTRSDRRLSDATWISNDELAFIAEDDSGYDHGQYRLNLLDCRTKQVRLLLEDTFRIILSVTDQPEILVLQQFNPHRGTWTIKYNARTGKDFDLEDPSAGYYLVDRQGNARVWVNYDEDRITYRVRPAAEARWHSLDDVVKQPGLHFDVRGAQLLDRVADVHSIGPDGDTLYVSTRLGTNNFELAAFSMSEGVIKRTIAKHPRYDLTTNDNGITRLLFAKSSPRLIGIVFEAQKPQVVWLDPGFSAAQKSIDRTLPDHVNLPIDWSQDGATLLYHSTSDRDPGTYYAFRPLEGRLIPLLELGDRLKGRSLAQTTPFEFTARDGEKIPAYVTRPSGEHHGPAPLIVWVHGGPMHRDSWRFDAENQFFASRGYLVLQVNYRGSSGYGAAFQRAGLHARLDTTVIDDIADGARYLIAQGEADARRVVVMGASFGGWATYISLAKYPDLYCAGVAISAVSNWKKSLRQDRWVFGNKMAYTFWNALLKRGSFPADEPFIEPYLRAKEIRQPLLIMHGERDTRVGASEAELMFDTIKKANPNAQLILFPHASHGFWPLEDQVVRLNAAAKFLDKHLTAQATLDGTKPAVP